MTQGALDIALMHRGGLELVLGDHVGLGPAGTEIADLEFAPLRKFGCLVGARLDAAVVMRRTRAAASGFSRVVTSITCGRTS